MGEQGGPKDRGRALASLFGVAEGAPGAARRTQAMPSRSAGALEGELEEPLPLLTAATVVERARDGLVGGTLHDFAVDGALGRGASAAVYLAHHVREGYEVAVKVLADAWEPEALRRFARESSALERLDHPNVVRLLGRGETPDGRPYFMMELVRGRSLRDALGAGPLADARAARIVRELAEGLAAAHAEGVLHRDLKPANVMLAELPGGGEVAKLVNFGCTRSLGAEETRLTQPGALLGTPAFMAPEQAADSATATAAADVYALGAVLYAMIAGRPPFTSEPLAVLVEKQLGPPPPPPHAGGLGPLALELLALRPEARPSALEVIERVEALRLDTQVTWVPSETKVLTTTRVLPGGARPTVWVRRGRAMGLAVALSVGTATVVAGAVALRGVGRAPVRADPAGAAETPGPAPRVVAKARAVEVAPTVEPTVADEGAARGGELGARGGADADAARGGAGVRGRGRAEVRHAGPALDGGAGAGPSAPSQAEPGDPGDPGDPSPRALEGVKAAAPDLRDVERRLAELERRLVDGASWISTEDARRLEGQLLGLRARLARASVGGTAALADDVDSLARSVDRALGAHSPEP